MTERSCYRLPASGLPCALVSGAMAVVILLVGVTAASARPVPLTAARQISSPLFGVRTFALAPGTTHIAVHWRGSAPARGRMGLGRGGRRFGAPPPNAFVG